MGLLKRSGGGGGGGSTVVVAPSDMIRKFSVDHRWRAQEAAGASSAADAGAASPIALAAGVGVTFGAAGPNTRFPKAVSLDGTAAAFLSAVVPDLAFDHKGNIFSAWVKFNAAGVLTRVVSLTNGVTATQGWLVEKDTANRLRFFAPGVADTYSVAVDVPAGWHHVTVVTRPAALNTARFRIYVNGLLYHEGTTAAVSFTAAPTLYWGAYAGGGSGPVSFADMVVSAAEPDDGSLAAILMSAT